MDSKLLFVNCITLLYLESEIPNGSSSVSLCQQVDECIKLPEGSVEMQSSREVAVGLRSTLHWMLDHREKTYDKTQLLQRVRVNTRDESHLYNALADVVEQTKKEETDENGLKTLILSYRKTLRDFLNGQSINAIMSQAFNKISFSSTDGSQIDYSKFVREVYDKLEPYTHDMVDTMHPSVVDHANFNDGDGMVELLQRSKEEISSDGVLVTGYQAFNRMLGDTGGFRRGEFCVIGALQHNFKTGFSMNLFKQLALYNEPYMRDEKKKPMLLHVSLENELPMNIMWLYANLIENETKEVCDINAIEPEEATRYIREKMGVNGYHIEMIRIEPGQCGYHDFVDMILKYETEGYEIHAIVCDYLNMLDKKGLNSSGGPAGEDIRDLFRRTRNVCSSRGITFITPHQLSSEAKMLVRQGVDNFVSEIANKGFYDGSKRLDQEVDLEIYIHIERIPGSGAFLTVQRGKHRAVKITPQKDLYCVLPFHDAGGVRDDLGVEDQSMSSVGGASASEGGGDWFDL